MINNIVDHKKILTIAIPTYNRKKQLVRLLKSIESQNCPELFYIIIFDNCSDYSVAEALDEEFTGDFRRTIEVHERQLNGGGDYNISSTFAYFKTTLFWLMGDDDEMTPGSIQKVIDNYNTYPEIPFFKYVMPGAFQFSDNIRLNNVDDLVMCHKKGYLLGGIIYMSNNIYNIDIIKPYLSDCLYYGYCSISQIIPMMHCLIDSDHQVLLCKDYIVKYNAPEGDHWNYLKIVTSLSTFLDINWGNNYKEVQKFFSVVSSYFGIGEFLIDNIKITDKSYRKYIYWKGIHTVFGRRKSLQDLFALSCYWLERWTSIKFLTGVYVGILKKQADIKKSLTEKAKTNASVAKLRNFLKKHIKPLG